MSAAQTLYVKPLADHLTGLLSKLDAIDDSRMNQAVIDCVIFLTTELPRLDIEVTP